MIISGRKKPLKYTLYGSEQKLLRMKDNDDKTVSYFPCLRSFK